LFGSLSATGKSHGTERASLAGLLGKVPATCPPEFVDGLAAHPNEVHKVTIGPTTLNLTLNNIVHDATKGDFPHPNTMTDGLLAGNDKLYGLNIEWSCIATRRRRLSKPPEKAAFFEDDTARFWHDHFI
jgi:hypothetical protein